MVELARWWRDHPIEEVSRLEPRSEHIGMLSAETRNKITQLLITQSLNIFIFFLYWRDYPIEEEYLGSNNVELTMDNYDVLRIHFHIWLTRRGIDEEQYWRLLSLVLDDVRRGVSASSSGPPRPCMKLSVNVLEIVVYLQAPPSVEPVPYVLIERAMVESRSVPSVEPDRSEKRAMLESRMEYKARNDCGMVPTKREAQVMDRVEVDGSSDECCMVCLEDMMGSMGSLPCRHLFHCDCILQWLRTSHYCPVCRHELPTEEPWRQL